MFPDLAKTDTAFFHIVICAVW